MKDLDMKTYEKKHAQYVWDSTPLNPLVLGFSFLQKIYSGRLHF